MVYCWCPMPLRYTRFKPQPKTTFYPKTYSGRSFNRDSLISKIGVIMVKSWYIILIVITLVGLFAALQIIDKNEANTSQAGAEESLVDETKYGFNTQLYVDSVSLNYDDFTDVIDELVEQEVQNPIVRFQLESHDVFPRTHQNSYEISCQPRNIINCDPQALAEFDKAINYAEFNNVDVYLVVFVPYWAQVYTPPQTPGDILLSLDDYSDFANEFLDQIMSRWHREVDMWELFNEPNHFTFDSYQPIQFGTDPNYDQLLRDVINNMIKFINEEYPDEKVAIGAGGRTFDETLLEQNLYFFERVGAKADSFAISVYPDDIKSSIEFIPEYINTIQTTFSKPIELKEIGVCSAIFGEEVQSKLLPLYLEKVSQSSTNSVILYQFKDNRDLYGECEQSYGVVDTNGVAKPALESAINEIKK